MGLQIDDWQLLVSGPHFVQPVEKPALFETDIIKNKDKRQRALPEAIVLFLIGSASVLEEDVGRSAVSCH
jgi:hypothetical protein